MNTKKEGLMQTHEFTVYLDRAPANESEYDRLFEAGLDDSTPEEAGGRAMLRVARSAATLADAIVSVAQDLAKAGFRAVGVENEDLVTTSTVAARLGRTRESVRLLAAGKRGPGGFPPPVVSGDARALYSWAAVRAWFERNYGETLPLDDADEVLTAADLLLRARALTPALGRLSELVAV
jgi:hypothetical protein